MTYSAVDIAKYIVSYCTKKQSPVSNLKLQKMLYYAWIDFYKATGEVLFGEDICAWQLGPVVPEAYYAFCAHAGLPISRTYDFVPENNDISTINKIIDDYLPLSASRLVGMSHRKGGPWDKIYQDGAGNRDVIPFQLIKLMECATDAE